MVHGPAGAKGGVEPGGLFASGWGEAPAMGAKGDAMGSQELGGGGGANTPPHPTALQGWDEQRGGPAMGGGLSGTPFVELGGGWRGACPISLGSLPTFQLPHCGGRDSPPPDPPLLFLPHPKTLSLCQEPWHPLPKWPHGFGGGVGGLAGGDTHPPRLGDPRKEGAGKSGGWKKGRAGKRGGQGWAGAGLRPNSWLDTPCCGMHGGLGGLGGASVGVKDKD